MYRSSSYSAKLNIIHFSLVYQLFIWMMITVRGNTCGEMRIPGRAAVCVFVLWIKWLQNALYACTDSMKNTWFHFSFRHEKSGQRQRCLSFFFSEFSTTFGIWDLKVAKCPVFSFPPPTLLYFLSVLSFYFGIIPLSSTPCLSKVMEHALHMCSI